MNQYLSNPFGAILAVVILTIPMTFIVGPQTALVALAATSAVVIGGTWRRNRPTAEQAERTAVEPADR